MSLFDKEGFVITLGDDAEMPEPNKTTDSHQHSFIGTVVGINEETELVAVEDQDGDCFEIEPNRISLKEFY